jgi:hypothetical protein
VPLSEQDVLLSEAAIMKRQMLSLLLDLEAAASKQTESRPLKPGTWRHDPNGWLQRYR